MSPSERERIDDAPEPYQGVDYDAIIREMIEREDAKIDRYKEELLDRL